MKTEQTQKSILLSCAVILGVVPHVLNQSGVTIDVETLTMPLRWLGNGLRGLALSGNSGNLAAWCIVLAVCALPLLAVMVLERRDSTPQWENKLLMLLVPELFALLYFLVNPTHVGGHGLGGELSKSIFGLAALCTILSTLAAWLVLRELRKLEGASAKWLAEQFQRLLVVCAFLMTVGGVYYNLSELSQRIAAMEAANSGDVSVTVRVLLLLTILRFLPDLWAADTLMWSSKLARELGRSTFDTQTVQCCQQTAKAGKRVVRDTMLVTGMVNLVQLILMGQLHDSYFRVEFPLFTLAVSSSLFLLSRCLQYGKQLQEDVESII